MRDFLWIVVLVLVAGLAFAATRQIAAARSSSKQPKPAPIYLEMRTSALHMEPAPAGATADTPKNLPYALVTDLGFENGTATIMATVGGSASVYFSGGGGNIGGEGIPAIRAAAKRCAEVAAMSQANFRPDTTFPLPKPGQVLFYAVSANGVTSAEDSQTALESRNSKLSDLYSCVQDIITGFRQSDPPH